MKYKGAPVLIGIALIAANFLTHLFFPNSFLATSEFLLHLGLITALMGLLIGDVIG